MDDGKESFKQNDKDGIRRGDSYTENYGTAAAYSEPRWFIQTRNTIYYILGVIEVLLAFRLLFLLLGASSASSFVSFLYSVTYIFIAPFSGIFKTLITRGNAAQYVLEPAAIIAMLIYAVAARGLVSLFRLRI